ncbi:MAG: TetR/AcrR family transcriptional regulator [Chloroflexota bacterium]|nr:TetR/AcrR family transcriptional regulator [Chloroflexota bacterium]
MRTAIVDAFQALLQETSYEALTVGNITERANVGRSTFYRYFETKTDLLIAMHEAIFLRFNFVSATEQDWLKDDPPPALIEFLRHMKTMERLNPAYYTLTKDLTYSREMMLIMRRVTDTLSHQVETGLAQAFVGMQSSVPLPLLAQSIVGNYTTLFAWWLTHDSALTPDEVARHIHHLTRAMIREALSL